MLYCITFSIMLVFFYPIFASERQEIDPVVDGRINKASLVLGRQAPARSRYGYREVLNEFIQLALGQNPVFDRHNTL